MSRKSIKCSSCEEEFRTRREDLQKIGLCEKCLLLTAELNLSVPDQKSGVVDWRNCGLSWIRELLFWQIEQDGLEALGFGPLRWIIKEQRQNSRMGQFFCNRETLDFLLRGPEDRYVGIEVRKRPTKQDFIQLDRLAAHLKAESKKRGIEEDPWMVLISTSIPPEMMAESNPNHYYYRLGIFKDNFQLWKVGEPLG